MSECRKCEAGDHEDCLLFDLDAQPCTCQEPECVALNAEVHAD